MASVREKVNWWFVICTEYHDDGDQKQFMCVRGEKLVNQKAVLYMTDNGGQCRPIEDEGTAAAIEYSRWLRPKYNHPCYHHPMQFISEEEEKAFDAYFDEEHNAKLE